METEAEKEAALARLTQLHQRIDERVADLKELHGKRLHCARECAACCTDGLTVFEVEAEQIIRRFPALLANEAPHPEGACAFLDEQGACRVYSVRPYVCRTQGLPLRWLEETRDHSLVEYRDICPLNESGKPLESLTVSACWSIGETESLLAGIQHQFRGNKYRRSLRDLFSP